MSSLSFEFFKTGSIFKILIWDYSLISTLFIFWVLYLFVFILVFLGILLKICPWLLQPSVSFLTVSPSKRSDVNYNVILYFYPLKCDQSDSMSSHLEASSCVYKCWNVGMLYFKMAVIINIMWTPFLKYQFENLISPVLLNWKF